uniref:Uncharacterized protein LOC113793851 n=1 Tax=Dermatophagoides pteronyssinus TaxID=6956 RepID=A0A6P6Y384_DERPT
MISFIMINTIIITMMHFVSATDDKIVTDCRDEALETMTNKDWYGEKYLCICISILMDNCVEKRCQLDETRVQYPKTCTGSYDYRGYLNCEKIIDPNSNESKWMKMISEKNCEIDSLQITLPTGSLILNAIILIIAIIILLYF